jgi:transposase
MKIILTPEEQSNLESRHRTERNRRVADRIKAVLLHHEGWSQVDIAQALRIRSETVHDHLREYKESQKLEPSNGGSQSQLTEAQSQELANHLEEETYLKVKDIGAYVKRTYGILFTVSGMTKWLKRMGFSYKKPKATPAKADSALQAAFIEEYEQLLANTSEEEPILFGDGVHPTMATKISYGWIRKGKKNDKLIETTASRTRMNLMGSLNLETMSVTINAYETLDSKSMDDHFRSLRQQYPNAPKIHQILDRGPYNISKETKEAAEKYGIVLHFLPPYSPNLNPIERLWKVMNEHVRNNKVFASAQDFREKIMHFFKVTWTQISMSMVDRINDNFQILKKQASSS